MRNSKVWYQTLDITKQRESETKARPLHELREHHQNKNMIAKTEKAGF